MNINQVGEREGEERREDGALEQDAKLPNGWAVEWMADISY